MTGCIHLVNNWLEEELAWLPPYLLEMEVGSNANGECTQGLDVRLSQAIYKFQWWMINFVIPSKEDDEQIKSYLRTSIYCKIHLVANKSTRIIHNELIMQQED